MKVLIVTYYWPPASSSGVYRFVKFAKFLPAYGYEPIVLTVNGGSYPSRDESLLEEVSHIPVYRASSIEPFGIFNRLTGRKGNAVPIAIAPKKGDSFLKRLLFFVRANFFIPDARVGWVGSAYRKAKKIIREEQISVVITTGPPHSTHLVGRRLKKRFNVRWIADLRDPWTNIYYNLQFPRMGFAKKMDLQMESSVLSKADLVTVVSRGMYEEFKDRAKRIELIYNGFDETDIPEKQERVTDKFVLAYVGNLQKGQNVEALWQALKELCQSGKEFSDYFCLELTGNIAEDVLLSAREYGVSGLVQQGMHVAHKQAVEKMSAANLLLFVIPQTPNNRLIVTGKLFEYLACRTPVLAIGPTDGDAAWILKQKHRGEMFDFEDGEGIKRQLKYYFDAWMASGKTMVASKEDLQEYTRKGLTRKLAGLMGLRVVGDCI